MGSRQTAPKQDAAALDLRVRWLSSWHTIIRDTPPAKRQPGWEALEYYVASLLAEAYTERLNLQTQHERN